MEIVHYNFRENCEFVSAVSQAKPSRAFLYLANSLKAQIITRINEGGSHL